MPNEGSSGVIDERNSMLWTNMKIWKNGRNPNFESNIF